MAQHQSAGRHLVFGAAGFIGLRVAERLAAQGCVVLGVDQIARAGAGFAWAQASFADRAALRDLLREGDIAYLLVGGGLPDAGNANPRRQLDETVGATLDFLETCREAKVARVLFPSSGGTVYGAPKHTPIDEDHPTEPIAAYGVQKLALEKYLAVYRHLHGLDSIVMRIANPFGPRQNPVTGQGLVAALARRALDGREIEIWGDGEVVRDYIFIDDAADAIAALGLYQGPARVFNVGAGVGRSVNQVVAALTAAVGPLNVVYRPGRPFDVPVSVLDIARVTRETGWTPRVSFEDGLARTLAWMRAAG